MASRVMELLGSGLVSRRGESVRGHVVLLNGGLLDGQEASRCTICPYSSGPVTRRAVLKEKSLRNAHRNERSRGRSLLRGQDMGKTQETVLNNGGRLAVGGWRLAVGGWWRLAVGGWWRLAVGDWWLVAVGGPWGLSSRAVPNKNKKLGFLRTALVSLVVIRDGQADRAGLVHGTPEARTPA